MGNNFEKVIADDLFNRIKSENSFLAELKDKIKDRNFELTTEDHETLEKIRARYRPEMKRLFDLGKFDDYNRIANLLILPVVFSGKK